MKALNVPVVRVKSYLKDEIIDSGSGIMIAPQYVLTATHVLCGDRHTVIVNGEEKDAVVEKKNHIAVLLAVETESKGKADAEKVWFTSEELLTRDTEWSVSGFITEEQNFHTLSGIGLIRSGGQEDGIDYTLKNIESGYAENYKGLSGSPVVCGGRIVGILQIQNLMERGLLGIEMSSTEQFRDIVPPEFLGSSQYREAFENKARSFTKNAIDKNIKSKKYIPDIFVEEGRYKENCRYYSEPDLFIKKAIEEIQSLDLEAVNRFLISKGEKELDFTDIADFAQKHTEIDVTEMLIKRLDAAVKKIERVRNKSKKQGLSLEKRYLIEDKCNYAVLYTFEEIRDEINFFRYKIILITNDAGQGKTNFLCDFAQNFLMKKRLPVLFYNAYDFREPFMNRIKKELTVDDAYAWEYVQQIQTQIWECEHKAITIMIDGLNENTALNDFGGYVSDFLKEVQNLPFIKVILSTRNELLEERFGQLNSETFGSTFYWMNMERRSDKFMERIFWGYLRYFDIEIMEGSLLDRTYEMLAEDTLLLRFFCEVNRGKRQVPMLHVYKYAMFKKYYDIKKEESIQEKSPGKTAVFDILIDHICQLMIQDRQFSKIPRCKLSKDELDMFDKLLEADVIFKQEMQIKKGYLKETEVFLSFTFDEFRDFCITRYILKSSDGSTLSSLWKTMHQENWGILEGVERYIFFLARTEGKDLLTVLKAEEEYTQLYWKNVWELEEADITTEDIEMWREEVLTDGVHATSAANFLISHRDRSYFKRTNIELFFGMLDELAEDLGIFEKVTQKFFRKTKKDKYGSGMGERAGVLSCDKLVDAFNEHKDDAKFIKNNIDFLRLSIYMVEIDASQIGTVWLNAHISVPEVVEKILELYIQQENLPQLLYQNIQIILEAFPDKTGENTSLAKLRTALDEKIRKYDYKAINRSLASVWN